MIVLLAVLGWAASPDSVRDCLNANDVPCAEREVAALGGESSADPEVLSLAAETRFYGGEYDDAVAIMQKAKDAGWADPYDDFGLYQRTADVMRDFAEVTEDRHVVRFRPGLDAILVPDAIDVVSKTEKNVAPLIGELPPGKIVVEMYPTGATFTAASSLSEENVKTTGVVAISKWSRLLVTSPRALGRGYGWQDTVSHEYIHLIVAHATDDRAPVWLQEAIARYLDNRWSDGKDKFTLSPRDRALLGDALAEDQGRIPADKQARIDKVVDWNARHPEDPMEMPFQGLVPFEMMHPSLAKLPSADMASLAYAQLASLMDYCFEQGGEGVLLDALPMVKNGTDPRTALAKATNHSTFDGLYNDWKKWISAQHLSGDVVADLPTALDGADESASDPILAGRADLHKFLRLGDLLAEQGHPKAALVEYAKAVEPDSPVSPLIANRIAKAKLDLGDIEGAKASLKETVAQWPEFALSHKTYAEILAAEGKNREALREYELAEDLNPFDPQVQSEIARIAGELGDQKRASRADAALLILKRGGSEPDSYTLLHPSAPQTVIIRGTAP